MNEKRFAPWMIAAVILAAFVVAGVLVGLSQLGGTSAEDEGEEVQNLMSGIPQDGERLGREDAPVEIRVYEDLQCPACAQFTRDSLSQIIEEHVKPGEVKLVSETLAFIGPDSVPAAKAALAAGDQDRHWQYATLFFLNQGPENGGYVTDEFMTNIAEQTRGLKVEQWNESREDGELESKLQEVQDTASDNGVESTPTIVVSGPGGERELVGAVPAEDVTRAIEEVE
jgi:protein-disulfide isomerase